MEPKTRHRDGSYKLLRTKSRHACNACHPYPRRRDIVLSIILTSIYSLNAGMIHKNGFSVFDTSESDWHAFRIRDFSDIGIITPQLQFIRFELAAVSKSQKEMKYFSTKLLNFTSMPSA